MRTLATIGQVSVRGTIFDGTTFDELFGVTVSLLDEQFNVISSTTLQEDSNTFTVWTDVPETRSVRFEKTGYAPTVQAFDYLQDNTEVFLTPLTAGNGLPTSSTTTTDIKKYWWVALLALPLLMKKHKQVGALKDEHIKWVLYGVGGLFAYKFIRDLLARFGLVEGQGGTQVNQQQQDPGSPWKPAYWKQFTSFSYQITQQQALDYSATIQGAFGVFQDDYNAVLSVFNNLRTKANVSYLADVFNQQYDADLLSFLTDGGGIMPWDGLSDAHLKQITDLVNNLPSH